MLIHVAIKSPALVTVGEVAQAFDLSLNHLNKVAQTLAEYGYLETVRGRSGGLRLARAPETIRLGELVAATEPDFQIAPCMEPSESACPIYDPCILRDVLSQAARVFLAELNKRTLADLVRNRKTLIIAIGAATSPQR
jgi:Rrf2 family nitric oxide-sensitive transcriptional repressor